MCATDDAWNKYILGVVRARVEELEATLNAHVHINLAIVFESDLTALHSTTDIMQHEAAKHRQFDARLRMVPDTAPGSVTPPSSTATTLSIRTPAAIMHRAVRHK